MDELTPIERSWAEAMPNRASGGCMEAEEILELAESGKRCQDYAARIAHVAMCPACRGTLKMLSATEQARPRRRFQLGLPVARGLVVAGLAATLLVAVWFGAVRGLKPAHSGTTIALHPTHPEKGAGIVSPNPKRPPRTFVKNTPEKRFSVPKMHRRVTPGIRREPNRHVKEIPLPPEPSRLVLNNPAEASGVLEGSVTYSEVLEGEVKTSEGVVVGEVTRKKSPPPPSP